LDSLNANGPPPAWVCARLPARQELALKPGVIPEPTPGDDRLVLWVPGARDGDYQRWQRVSTLPRGGVTVKEGLCATRATSFPARQYVAGALGRLFRALRKQADGALVLPDGRTAERCGENRRDLLLVWGEGGPAGVDEARVRSLWPEGRDVERLGDNLFLVSGIEPPIDGAAPLPEPPCPIPVTEGLLAAARQRGDRQGEALAQTDLGILRYHEGDYRRATAHLQEALAICRELGDRRAESEVLGQLGLVACALGQAGRGCELLEQALRYAREAGDRFPEKLALAQLGLVRASADDPAGARDYFEQALALARELGDRKHEPELLWYLGIQHARLGERERALAYAQATVDFLNRTGNPQAAWYAHHLERYRADAAGAGLGDAGAAALDGGLVGTDFWPGPTQPPPTSGGPSLLGMAFSAGKSMAKFLGSGLKTVTPEVHQKRVQTCASCEHHTGIRCRLCGCFTNAKTRMAHEVCPIGKWA
jgi:tetratricopeptide (TPR) repeat protein